MPTDAALLAEVPFFQLLDESDRESLASHLELVKIAAGQPVFEYGDPGDSVFIIRAGAVEIFFRDDTGTRIVLETLDQGGFFGELSLLDGGSRTAGASWPSDSSPE